MEIITCNTNRQDEKKTKLMPHFVDQCMITQKCINWRTSTFIAFYIH